MIITMQTDIAAPVATVWALLEEPEKLPLWMPEVVETIVLDGESLGGPIGSRFRQTMKEGGRLKTYDGTVTAHDRERLFGVRLSDGAFDVDVTYGLSPGAAGGTRLDYTAEIAFHSWFTRLIGTLFKPLTMRILKRHMAHLKRVAEADAASGR